MNKYSQYFGFKSEPFTNEIPIKKLLKLPGMVGVKERMDYVIEICGVMVVTGDVGSGKSTSLRWSHSHHHDSALLKVNILANSGSIGEFYKQLCWGLDLDIKSASRSFLLKKFKDTLLEIAETKKQKIILIIDEAHLLRSEVFAELHILTQFENDSKNVASILLAGQANLIDRLKYRDCQSLASRVIARTHLGSITRDQMEEYLIHHLKNAGIKKNIFSESAITAIHQGAGGMLRKANSLAKGGLIAAAMESASLVSSENIRTASTEII